MIMTSFRSVMLASSAAIVAFLTTCFVQAEEVVNVYSARHYDTDDSIYDEFTAKTGIKVN